MTLKHEQPDKTLVAACGLFCPSCAIFIASNEDPERLEGQAGSLNLTVEETRCEGCRSQKRNANCNKCFMLKCTTEKGIDFCSECAEYPCKGLKDFQAVMPHRIELWKQLFDYIKDLVHVHGTNKVEWYLNNANHGAIDFYKKIGAKELDYKSIYYLTV
jgi:hypothetical protein